MKVLFIDNTHPILKKELELNGFICEEETSKSKEKIMYNISSYDGIVIRSRFKIDSAFLEHSNNLKFIARAGSGMENIDVKYANKKGIKCYNAPEGNRQAVAEHTLGILLSLFNNISRSHLEIKKKKWIREKNRGIEIQGKKIAIIGYGNNGAAFAKLLENFGVTIMSYDKYLYNYSYKTSMKKTICIIAGDPNSINSEIIFKSWKNLKHKTRQKINGSVVCHLGETFLKQNSLGKIQSYLKDKKKVKLLSFSVTPEIDSVQVLKEYSIEKGIVAVEGQERELAMNELQNILTDFISKDNILIWKL